MSLPVSDCEFAALMDRFGLFEPAPRVAVAVSGGADSMALTLCADRWARGRGGAVVALTVDHGLRADSAAEAALVGVRLAAVGIDHRVLPWSGDKPTSDVQARARDARYGLLEEFCRNAGILHLATAHHRDDQAETLLLRLARGSGVDGMAAMAAASYRPDLRVLRPFLDVPKDRLRASLAAEGRDWVEDPSNRDPRYARVRMRGLSETLRAEGLDAARLAATARRMAGARDALDDAVAQAFLRFGRLHPAGYAQVRAAAWRALSDEIALRLTTRLVRCIGGSAYPPRLDRSQGLLARLRAGQGGALAGCRIDCAGGDTVFAREVGRMAAPVALAPGDRVIWDGRYQALAPPSAPADLRFGGLGAFGVKKAARLLGRRLNAVPACARPAIPAIFSQDGISAVPHLGYNPWGESLRIQAKPTISATAIAHCLV